jgi:polyhydroxyalkanoate synthase
MTEKAKIKPHKVPAPDDPAETQDTFCGPHRKLPPVKALADEDVPLLDRLLHASMGRIYGLSPAALGLTYADWLIHLALAPGKQAELAGSATDKMTRLADFILRQSYGSQPVECCAEPLSQDRRFVDQGWN